MSDTYHCERCGEKLNPKTMTWLELNHRTNTWHAEKDPVPEKDSQGCFAFGVACAKQVLKAGGQLIRIKSRERE